MSLYLVLQGLNDFLRGITIFLVSLLTTFDFLRVSVSTILLFFGLYINIYIKYLCGYS